MQPTHLNPILKSGISQRIELRRRLGISASELELLEVIAEAPRSLSQIAALLGLSKKGVDKAAARLVEKSLLIKSSTGRLIAPESLTVALSTTKTKFVELSTTNFPPASPESVALSTTNDKIVELSTTKSNEPLEIVELSTTKIKNVAQSTTADLPAPAGSSNIIIKNSETLEEQKKEEKTNPPKAPLDKKEEQKVKPAPTGLNVPFDDWWNAYDKKVDRSPKLEAKWAKLTDSERTLAMQHTALYIKATPDKKFRKNPETYLNNKSFNNEIIPENGKTGNLRPTSLGIAPIGVPTRPSPATVQIDKMAPIEL